MADWWWALMIRRPINNGFWYRRLAPFIVVACTASSIHPKILASVQEERADVRASNVAPEARLAKSEPPEFAGVDSLSGMLERALAEGRFPEAERLARQQLKNRRRQQATSAAIACTLRQLSLALWRLGRFADSEACVREAIAMHALLGRESEPEFGICLNVLGVVLMAQGRFGEAETAYRTALENLRAAYGDEHEWVASVIGDIGALYHEQGDPVAAEPYRRAALAIARKLYGPKHAQVALALHNLAAVLQGQRDYVAAEPLYREALNMRIELLGMEHPDTAFTMARLATMVAIRGRKDEGVDMLRRAIDLEQRRLGRMHPRVAIDVATLAGLYHKAGRYQDALRATFESLDIRRAVYGEQSFEVLRLQTRVAATYASLDRWTEADSVLEHAIRLNAVLGANHGASLLLALGNLKFGRGDIVAAESLIAIGAGLHERSRLRSYDLERRAGRMPHLTRLAACRLLLQRPHDAWIAAEAGLARVMEDALLLEARTSAETAIRMDSLELHVGELRAQLAALTQHGDHASTERLRVELLEAEASLKELHVKQRSTLEGVEALSLKDVQESLDARTAIIGWVDHRLPSGDPAAWGYTIRSTGPVLWVRLHVGEAARTQEREADATRYRRILVSAASWPDRVTATPRLDALGRRIAEERVDPLLPDLQGIENLIVIPSGPMTGLPFEALPMRDGRTCADRFAVSYTLSATLHARLKRHGRRADVKWGLVVGDPAFGSSDVTGAAEAPLPASASEAQCVAKLFPAPTMLVGREASEQALAELARTPAMRQFDIVHFATHAYVDDVDPGKSALLLTSLDLPDPVQCALDGRPIYDGKLTADEVRRQWNIDAQLVVLSACETALGRQAHGDGYLGLAHSFLRAGARSVLVSLWPVDDQATQLLMSRFYECLLRTGACASSTMVSRSRALRDAKLWLRSYKDENGVREFSHPAYWSGFILLGDPGQG